MGKLLSTERIHKENGTGEIQNNQGNSNIIMNTVPNNILTMHNESASADTLTIVQGSSNIVNTHTHAHSTREPVLEDYNFPKPIDSFKGRDGEFEQLDDYLFQKIEQMVVIWGLPGFGKSELLKQFAHKCKLKKKIKYICWIETNNQDKDSLEHSLKNLAEILNLPKVDGRALMQKVSSRYHDSGTLFMFDDVDSPRSLLDWETPRGCWTLVSSKCGEWGTKPRIELGPLELEAAVSVLQDSVVTADPYLYNLAELLDNAPLALQLAAAYIRQEEELFPKDFNLLQYIEKLEKSREEFVNETLPEHTLLPYQYSIQAAMKLSIEKIKKRNKFESNLALDILNISAYLHPNLISVKLLLKFSFIKNKLKEVEDKEIEKNVGRALYVLQSHSFVHLEDGYVRIHGLVQHSLIFHHNKLNENIDTFYTCLEYVLNNEFNWHSETILRQADKRLEIFKKFYEEYKSTIIKNKSSLNYETLRVLITMITSNREDAHKSLLASKVKNDFKSCDINFENLIKDISNYSFLQILVLAGAEKCLTFSIEELGSQAKEVISEHQLLFSAIYSQQRNTINLLLRYEEDIDKIIIAGLPITHFAVCVLNIDNLNFLLQHNNIDVNARDVRGDTCIGFAIFIYFSDSMENLSVLYDKMRTLVDHGAFVYKVTNLGCSLLHVVVRNIKTEKDLKLVEFITDKLKVDVDNRDTEGRTALHVILERRLLHEIDDEFTGKLVDVLVKRGASIHVKSNYGYIPLHLIRNYKLHFLLPILESNNVAGSFHVLHYAVRILNLEILNVILEYNNTDVNARDYDGLTCIYKVFLYSCKTQVDIGDKICHIIRALVDRGASIYNVTNDGWSLLHVAVLSIKTVKYLKVVEFVIDELQMDINTRNTKGMTALHFILKRRQLQKIGDELASKMVDVLVKRGASVHIKSIDGLSPLDLIKKYKFHFLLPLLKSNNVTNDGLSLLHMAVMRIKTAKQLKIVELIVDELQVNVNTGDTYCRTALHFTLNRWLLQEIDDELTGKLVDILVKRGASIHVKDNAGYGSLDIILENEIHFLLSILESNNVAGSFHILHYAVSILNLDILNVILEYNNTDVNARDDDGLTCICKAFTCSCKMQADIGDKVCHIIRALVDRGASIYNVSNDGWSLLHVAVISINTAKDLKVVEFVIDELQVDMNTRNIKGMTPLHLILNRRQLQMIGDELASKMVDVLVKRGASVHIKSNDGYSPLHLIKKYEFHFLLPILESNGAYIY